MKVQHYFYILVLLIIGLGILVGGVTFYPSLREGKLLFYLVEGWSLVLLCYLFFFYRRVVHPLHTIAHGMEMLRAQDFSSRLAPVGQVEADRIVQLFNQLMSQLREERLRLREHLGLLDLLINASPLGVVMLDYQDHIRSMNPAARQFLGIHKGSSIPSVLHQLEGTLAEGMFQLKQGEKCIFRLGDNQVYRCSLLSFMDRGVRHPFYLIESLTQELIQAERAAYEQVIRMIAHEVNNSVAGISSSLTSIHDILAGQEGMEDILDVLQVCVERNMSMSQFITRFADVVKIPVPHFLSTDVNALLSHVVQLMQPLVKPKGVVLCWEKVEKMECKLDAVLMEQVLLNVLKNAMESFEKIKRSSDESLEIKVSLKTSPMEIIIANNGEVISPATALKLFTPFYSTKPKGQGIGLLFIREVLTAHGFSFSLMTDEDGWTRFCILLK